MINDHLEEIHAEHGVLTPQLVVDAATPKNHPLHHRFEWDNKAAGNKWRCEQASQLIRASQIIIEAAAPSGETRSMRVRKYVSVPLPEGSGYRDIQDVKEDTFLRKLVLNAAEREWRALYRRYADIAEFMDIVRADIECSPRASASRH